MKRVKDRKGREAPRCKNGTYYMSNTAKRKGSVVDSVVGTETMASAPGSGLLKTTKPRERKQRKEDLGEIS